ncbi:MAG: cytochrome c3 family protein [Gallionella sp.]|nr:cytochrome c3 family protein [Gallionella sp.]
MNFISINISCRNSIILVAAFSMVGFGALTSFAWANPASYTLFTNIGSIANTRHNLTQQPIGAGAGWMGGSRNDYGEVCVYCHTPHGSQTLQQMPLWNRTIKATTYTTYDQLGTSTLTGTVSQPGNPSLTCLSCHDGQTAIDSIINMPGSGNYQASQTTTQNNTFLDTWPIGPVQWGGLGGHGTLSNSPATLGNYGECMACHSPSGDQWGSAAPDFDSFYIGTDLTNDHPVGITFPAATGSGTDWNTPGGTKGTSLYFDVNTNTKMDKDEIRIYSGQVECASCHDPHGVPDSANGNVFKPTFLRVANTGSALCLTCHNK